MMMKPFFNLNGSSPERYRDDVCEALGHLQAALAALGEIAPHGRDYQTCKDPSSYLVRAQFEHMERVRAIEQIESDLQALGEHAADAIRNKKPWRFFVRVTYKDNRIEDTSPTVATRTEAQVIREAVSALPSVVSATVEAVRKSD
jgi:hypothetical protein